MSNNTIYALSTTFSKSAIAIVRVSGVLALKSLLKLTNKKEYIPSKATLTNLYNIDGELLDKAVVIYFKAPNSYSGEDLVEYHVHGSIAVIKELLSSLAKMENHRLAEAGEFTKRALENNKIDLISAEGIADLINAETYQQKKQALRSLTGEVGGVYENYYHELKDIVALVEATIDFSDQDIPEDTFDIAFTKLDNLIKQMQNEINKGSKVNKLKQGIKVAIIGEPNTGKSSLINYLSKQDVAIVSNIAGTTRDVIEVFLDIAGYPIVLIDTAGMRETIDEIELEGIKRAVKSAQSSDLKLILLDATVLEKNQSVALESLKQFESFIDEYSIIVVNKIDLLSTESLNKIKQELQSYSENSFFISIKESLNIDILENKLANLFEKLAGIVENPIVMQQRHSEILQACLNEISLSLENKHDIVILAFHLRNALNQIGKILGKVDIEDILGLIFSNFCIGK